MSPLPRVVICGRPNVGKSSLLNRLAGRRIAIVEPTAGVTRDRIDVLVEHGGRHLEIIDTGGLGLVDEDRLKQHIELQITAALGDCDLVLFVVDGKLGQVPGDEMVAQRLRRLAKPVLLVVNKVESYRDEMSVAEWFALGFGEPLPVSAKEGFGIHDLLDRVLAELPEGGEDRVVPAPGVEAEAPGEDLLSIAVVGKRNSGKSTLVNTLVGEERVIVSDIPGTTRDAIDVLFEYRGRRMKAIDTAGVRKKRSLADAIEFYSHSRALDSIRRADVVVHLFDVHETISQVDKKLAACSVEQHKPVVLAGNKIDAAGVIDLDGWDRYIKQQLPGLGHAPAAFVSAKEGQGVGDLLGLVVELREQARTTIPTARLNEVLQAAKAKLQPKHRSRIPKLFYGTQIGCEPVRLLIFVNEPKLFRGQYERYLSRVLREAFDCEEVPLQLVFRRREKVELPPL